MYYFVVKIINRTPVLFVRCLFYFALYFYNKGKASHIELDDYMSYAKKRVPSVKKHSSSRVRSGTSIHGSFDSSFDRNYHTDDHDYVSSMWEVFEIFVI